MLFLKDPFTGDITGPLGDAHVKELAAAGKIGDSWEISRSKDGPWMGVSKVKGLDMRRESAAAGARDGRGPAKETRAEQVREQVPSQPATTSTGAQQFASDLTATAISGLRSQIDSVRRSNLASSGNLFDLFDWRFRKYLTPWILRVTWIIVLLVAFLWILLQLFWMLTVWLPDMQWAADAAPQVAGRLPRGNIREPLLPLWLGYRLQGTLWHITAIAGSVIALLWVRVALEIAVVLFNIATTLTAIQTQIKDGKESS